MEALKVVYTENAANAEAIKSIDFSEYKILIKSGFQKALELTQTHCM